jgi:hypothetical protein
MRRQKYAVSDRRQEFTSKTDVTGTGCLIVQAQNKTEHSEHRQKDPEQRATSSFTCRQELRETRRRQKVAERNQQTQVA